MTRVGSNPVARNFVRVDSSGPIITVRMARPPVNALTVSMMDELRTCFTELGEASDARVIVLAADGEKAFCAGRDLNEDRAALTRGFEALDPGRRWRETQRAVRHCAVPVIAAVDGPALGAGFGLAAMCDIIVASRRATFGLPEVNVGLLGGASKALRMLGAYRARWLLFTGEPLSAEQLFGVGAVALLAEDGEAENAAAELARKLAAKSPVALRLAKESMLRIEGDAVEDQYRIEQDYTAKLAAFEDAEEAQRAFVERRPPVWTVDRR